MTVHGPGITSGRVVVFSDGSALPSRDDRWCVEQPLELRLDGEPLAVTMRTPGHDGDLTLGFALAEGIIEGSDDVAEVRCHSGADSTFADLRLRSAARGRVGSPSPTLRRGTLTTSSCGVCGRSTVSDLLARCAPLAAAPTVSAALVADLATQLGAEQPTFSATGGSHAALIADLRGQVLSASEDVGRHNAVDKAVGRLVREDRLPKAGGALVVSGRTSFEIAQKALAASLGVVIGVSAPSSLAVEIAQRTGLILVGFARQRGFNVYAGWERVRG